ncbi:hypothetical protein ACFQ7H_33960, partial [Streptomyces sp. NPDC056492]
MPGDIEFTEEERDMLFLLTGNRPLQASSDKAYATTVPIEGYGAKLADLVDRIVDSFSAVRDGLPPDVAQRYVDAMGTFTGRGGTDHMGNLRRTMNDLANGQLEQSRNIMEGQWQILAEIIQLFIELAFLSSMSFFTGGLSLSEVALAKARTRLSLLILFNRVLSNAHLMPAFSEALQEAFTTFAVRVAMISLNSGNRKPTGIDWNDIGKSAAFGGLAGGFSSLFSRMFHALPQAVFKKDDLNHNKWFKEGLEGGGEVLGEGFGESTAETFVNGFFENKWAWSPDTFGGAVVSSISEAALGGLFVGGAQWARQAFFKPSLSPSPGFTNSPSTFHGGDNSADPLPLDGPTDPGGDLLSGPAIATDRTPGFPDTVSPHLRHPREPPPLQRPPAGPVTRRTPRARPR